MKSAILAALFLAVTATAAPVEITCGNKLSGRAVTFSISPLKRVIEFSTFENGVLTAQSGFGPSHGIYDRGHLDFSGRDFFDSDLYIHGSYAQILRINHFSGVTIGLNKKHAESGYTLTQFSSGYIITSDFNHKLKEETHQAFIGLTCTIVGL